MMRTKEETYRVGEDSLREYPERLQNLHNCRTPARYCLRGTLDLASQTMSMVRRRREAKFFWQGLLIVLPAFLLAGVGIFSLRQDRVLAEHDATEQAQELAGELLQSLRQTSVQDLPKRLPFADPSRLASLRLDDEPLVGLAHSPLPRIACLIDESGKLVYPPVAGGLPVPHPPDPDSLDSEQRQAWGQARAAWYEQGDAALALEDYGRLLALAPPAEFAALAVFHQGVLTEDLGRVQEASSLFQRVRDEFSEAVGETGLPLRPLAELHLAEAPLARGVATAGASLSSACAWAVSNPGPLTELVLDWAESIEQREPSPVPGSQAGRRGGVAARWRAVWQQHETARAYYETCLRPKVATNGLAETGFSFWGDWNGTNHWVTLTAAENGLTWATALSADALQRLVTNVVADQSRPAYFGVGVFVGDRPILAAPVGARRLATSASGTSAEPTAAEGTTTAVSPWQVQVFLTDANALYARQRVRTRWFGALIATSALAVLLGFVTAFRAFQRQQQLSELKTNFVSSVSHELRTPIASVRLMVEELDDTARPDPERARAYHRFISQECRRLSALIENVLDFARHEQGRKHYEFEPTDLVGLTQETVRLMNAYGADRRVSISTRMAGTPVAVEADGRSIQQVLVNLLDNAIKHSPEGGGVTVGLEFPDPPADRGDPPRPPTHRRVRLSVEDQGPGIPPEEHERIFERFYRRGSELRRETTGVGLGLAIVKYVAEAHGGTVTVRSAVGQGSQFTVELPLTQNSTSDDHQA